MNKLTNEELEKLGLSTQVDDNGDTIYWKDSWSGDGTYIVVTASGQYQAVFGSNFVDNYQHIENAIKDIEDLLIQ